MILFANASSSSGNHAQHASLWLLCQGLSFSQILSMIILFLMPSPQLPINSLFQWLRVLAWQLSPRFPSLFHLHACIWISLIFASQKTPSSLTYPLSGAVMPALSSSQSPWSSVIALYDDASELGKTICIFCFAVFYFSAFAVWCFSLEEV